MNCKSAQKVGVDVHTQPDGFTVLVRGLMTVKGHLKTPGLLFFFETIK